MLVIGLTGGISSGKSTISSWFLERGIIVLDADQIVRELQKAGSPLLDELAQAFGPTIINENGELVREALAAIIFNDENKKAQLNQMIHPLVKNKMIEGIEEARQKGEKLIILDVPLLFESEFESLTDCTLVVYVSQKTQLKRLMKRDGIEEAYALLKINSQMSLEKKRERADYLLINEGSIRELRTKFEEMFEILWGKAYQLPRENVKSRQ
ncbi:MAG: dephospho-CoA kinase [Turicibacter sp.]|nr:dephospho-CoA kinase [Turicibacter sp.]